MVGAQLNFKIMKNKIIRLTENDIQNLVQKIIKESYSDQELLLQVDDISEILGHEDMVGAFSDLAEAADYLYDEMYDGNHGSIMTKKIEDLLTQIYEVIGWPDDEEFEDEDYMQDMPKPGGIGQKLKQGARDLFNLSNKNDSETLVQIHNLIQKGMVDNVRHNGDAITAWLNNKALIVDRGRNPEIIYGGRNLEIADLEYEADDLYSELINFL